MARYNAWQNTQLTDSLDGVGDAVLRQDRGAFFGSILGTLNHLLWGDTLWISRALMAGRSRTGAIPESHALHPTFAAWSAERFRLDRRITHWAERLNTIDLKGDLTWYSGALGRDMTKTKALCVVAYVQPSDPPSRPGPCDADRSRSERACVLISPLCRGTLTMALISPSRRLRRTPFSDGVEAAGVKAYTVYNRMLLPTVFESVRGRLPPPEGRSAGLGCGLRTAGRIARPGCGAADADADAA